MLALSPETHNGGTATMNATEKFALERDAFERRSLGLPPREFANPEERVEFARVLLTGEAARKAASRDGKK
jgi:hypothetical protein